MAHFSLGVQEIKEPQTVDELIRLASASGYRLGS